MLFSQKTKKSESHRAKSPAALPPRITKDRLSFNVNRDTTPTFQRPVFRNNAKCLSLEHNSSEFVGLVKLVKDFQLSDIEGCSLWSVPFKYYESKERKRYYDMFNGNLSQDSYQALDSLDIHISAYHIETRSDGSVYRVNSKDRLSRGSGIDIFLCEKSMVYLISKYTKVPLENFSVCTKDFLDIENVEDTQDIEDTLERSTFFTHLFKYMEKAIPEGKATYMFGYVSDNLFPFPFVMYNHKEHGLCYADIRRPDKVLYNAYGLLVDKPMSLWKLSLITVNKP